VPNAHETPTDQVQYSRVRSHPAIDDMVFPIDFFTNVYTEPAEGICSLKAMKETATKPNITMDIKNTKGPEAPARLAINATLMDIAIVGARIATDKAVVSIMFS
jgi:hypothetical protein